MNPLTDIGLVHYLVLSSLLFSAGMAAVIMRRNAVVVLMGLELILNAASLNFIAFGRFGGLGLAPHVVVIFVITLAAAEAAVALAIVLNVYNRYGTITVDEIDQLKE